jgi:hypothetical protein
MSLDITESFYYCGVGLFNDNQREKGLAKGVLIFKFEQMSDAT